MRAGAKWIKITCYGQVSIETRGILLRVQRFGLRERKPEENFTFAMNFNIFASLRDENGWHIGW